MRARVDRLTCVAVGAHQLCSPPQTREVGVTISGSEYCLLPGRNSVSLPSPYCLALAKATLATMVIVPVKAYC